MKKNLMIAGILVLVGILVACSSRQQYSANRQLGSANGSGTGSQAGSSTQSAGLPLESKVGIGILKLEGTDQAVDEAKAKDLLVLFKALKTLSSEGNTAVDEIRALNTQIKNTMTADQLAAIEKMSITTADLQTLMQTYGISAGTTSSGTGSSNSSGERFGGPGGPEGGMMVGISGGSSSSRTQATPNAAAAMNTSRKLAGGYNLTFVDPIIKLLESKISK